MLSGWKLTQKTAYVNSVSLKGRMAFKAAVRSPVLIEMLDYAFGKVSLSEFADGKPMNGPLAIQNAYKNLEFYMNEIFKEKARGMSDLLERFNVVWDAENVSVDQMILFELRMRGRISRNVLNFSYESIDREFMIEWGEVKWSNTQSREASEDGFQFIS